MDQVTELVAVNGWVNLRTQAEADGYTGNPIVKEATVVNFNSTVAYLHVASAVQPSTGSDGLPLSSDTGTAPSSAFTLPPGTNISGVWIYTGSSLNIKYSVIS